MRTGLILLLAIGFAPFIALSAWYLNQQRTEALDRAYVDGELIASATAASVRWMLEDARTVMTSVAARVDVRDLDPDRCDPVFRELNTTYPAYDNIVLRRADGTVVCAPMASISGHSIAAAPWFREALRTPGFRAGPAFNAPLLAKWVALLTLSIPDDTGAVAAVLIMPLDIDGLRRRLYAHLPANALIGLVDGDGRVLARSFDHERRVGKPVLGELAEAVRSVHEERGRVGDDQAVSRRVARTGTDGVRRLQVVRTIPGSTWTVLAAFPEDAVLASYRAERTRHILALLATFALAGFLGWRFMRKLLQPAEALAATASAVAAGCEDARAPESGPTELMRVAQQLNRMLDVQRAARETLVTSHSRQRALLEALPAGVLVYDTDGRIEYCNTRTAEIVGLSSTDLHGRSAGTLGCVLFAADGTRLAVDALPVHRVIRSGAAVHEVVAFLTPDAPFEDRVATHVDPSRLRFIQLSAHPEHDDHGRLLRVIVAFVEVTAQRVADAMRMARDAAEAANKAKSEFLSRMSHDLRTPLIAVMGYSQLFQMDRRLPEDVHRKAGLVLAGCRQLLALIDESLDLARIEAGALRLELESLPVDPVIGECLALCEPLARPRGVTLVAVPTAAGAALALADRTRLHQILMNLVSNAIKYNRVDGLVTVSVHTRFDDSSRRVVDVEVRDTGVGLTEAQRMHLFEPFNRLGAEAGGTEGSGLGLVISRALAHAMGGELSVASTPDVGSCFTLRLRADPRPAALPEPESAKAPAL